MPDPSDARRIVSAKDIARLAELFDRFQYADDPLSVECQEAQRMFHSLVRQLYEQSVEPYYQSITLSAFRAKIIAECHRYLRHERRPS